MKRILSMALIAITGLFLVSCGPRYEAIINVEDFDKSWNFDASIDTRVTFAHTMGKTDNPNQGQQALLDQQIAEFSAEMKEKHGWNVSVVHEQYGGYTELQDRLEKELATGNEPSMAYAYPDHVASYIPSDKVLPLDNLINNSNSAIALSKADYADYVDSFLQEGREYDLNGTTLSVPFSKSTEVMFYNKTFFEKNNLDVPVTWDEVETVSKKIIEIAGSDVIPFGYDSDDNLFIVRSAQLGAPYTGLDPNTLQGQILFNNDKSKAMVEDLVKLHKDGILTTKGIIGDYTSNQFKIGKLMMAVGSTGGTNHNIPTGGEFEVGVAPMPQETNNAKDAKTILQGPSVVFFRKGIRPAGETDDDGNPVWQQPVPTQAQKNEMIAAWMFYKYITRPENTIRQAMGTGYLPVRVSAYEEQSYLDFVENASSAADRAKADVLKLAKVLMETDAFFVSPAFASSSKARTAVGILLIDAMNNKGTIENLFRRAEAQAS